MLQNLSRRTEPGSVLMLISRGCPHTIKQHLSLEDLHTIFAAVDDIQADAPPPAKGRADTAGIAANKVHAGRLRELQSTYTSGSQAQKHHAGYIKALKKRKGTAYRKSCFARAAGLMRMRNRGAALHSTPDSAGLRHTQPPPG